MESHTRKVLALVVGVLVASMPQQARSCECNPPGLVEARELSTAAFSGEVTSLFLIQDSPWGLPVYLAIVRVEDCWKGALQPGQRVQVWTPACVGCCGESFSLGSRHMLFVRDTDPLFYTSWCFGNTYIGPHVAAALGPPGCALGIDERPWSAVKRLYGEP